ncbi:MAG: helix-turn-helix transcriptional regulator [Blautia sp.]|nr:helix-turn-helix transcriptional regulator [Blautia sp.]MDY5031785.1 helix-turn-helix transcriptional regulator [Blautia sp.]
MKNHILNKLRTKHNYTEEYVARKMNMSQSAYSRLESGKTELSLERMEELERIYNMPVSEILEEYKNEKR